MEKQSKNVVEPNRHRQAIFLSTFFRLCIRYQIHDFLVYFDFSNTKSKFLPYGQTIRYVLLEQ